MYSALYTCVLILLCPVSLLLAWYSLVLITHQYEMWKSHQSVCTGFIWWLQRLLSKLSFLRDKDTSDHCVILESRENQLSTSTPLIMMPVKPYSKWIHLLKEHLVDSHFIAQPSDISLYQLLLPLLLTIPPHTFTPPKPSYPLSLCSIIHYFITDSQNSLIVKHQSRKWITRSNFYTILYAKQLPSIHYSHNLRVRTPGLK